MDKTMVLVLSAMFSGVIAFFIANTTAGLIIPVFDGMAASFGFMTNGVDYNTVKGVITSAYYLGIWIVALIPIAYLFMRLLRKEPEAERQGYYGDGWY